MQAEMKRLKSTFKNKKYYDSQIFLYQMCRKKYVSLAIFKNSFFYGTSSGYDFMLLMQGT